MDMNKTTPVPGRESVWDYPRPPRLESCPKDIKVVFAEHVIAQSRCSIRVLETSHPPVYYLPPEDVRFGVLLPTDRVTFCEWKGVARYFHVMVDDFTAENAAWSYDRPTEAFRRIRNHIAFYAHLMDGCYVDGERVQTQLGGFYGGWITKDIVGPFKGPAGTQGW